MKILSKLIIIIILILVIASFWLVRQEAERQASYEKCTSVCASVIGDDFVKLKLCMDKCKEKFLEEDNS